MRPTQTPPTVKQLMGVVALVAVVLGLVAIPLRRSQARGEMVRGTLSRIMSLSSRSPSGVAPGDWEAVVGVAVTAYGNIASSDSASDRALGRFASDLEGLLGRAADAGTPLRILELEARIGPYGRSYLERHFTDVVEGYWRRYGLRVPDLRQR